MPWRVCESYENQQIAQIVHWQIGKKQHDNFASAKAAH